LSEDLLGHPFLLHSLQVTQPTYTLPIFPFYYIFSFIQLFYDQLSTFIYFQRSHFLEFGV
jgi:hypothetical protein